MLFRSLAHVLVLLVAITAGLPVAAATIDFVALAAGNEGGATSIFFGAGDISNNVSGVTVTAEARNLPDTNGPFGNDPPNAYLDDLFGGRPGGLGVCQVLTLSDQCTPSSDDNISGSGMGEVAILNFSQTVEITEIVFSNGLHFTDLLGTIGVNVGASNPDDVLGFSDTFNAAVEVVNGVLGGINLIGSRFSIAAPESFGEGPGSGGSDTARAPYQLYVNSITFSEFPTVPEPTTAMLVGVAALGLVFGSRSRSSA